MSSKFLSGGSSLEALTDGTFNLNVARATIQNLGGNLPVRTTSARLLTTGLIQTTDTNFTSVLTQGGALNNLGTESKSFDVAYLQGGSIASWQKYKQTSLITIVAADGETSCTNVADQTHNWGSLTFTAPFFRGQTMKLDAFFTVASAGTDTFTFRLKDNGVLASTTAGNFNLPVAVPGKIEFDMFVAPNAPDQLIIFATQTVYGEAVLMFESSLNFNRSINHTFELTCQWSGVSLTDVMNIKALRCTAEGAAHTL